MAAELLKRQAGEVDHQVAPQSALAALASAPAELQVLPASEIRRWGAVIRAATIERDQPGRWRR